VRKKRFNKWLEKWHEEQPHAVDLCNAGGGAYPPELFQEKCEVVFPSGMPAPRPSCQGLSLISATVLRPELRGNKEIGHFRNSKKNGNALTMHEAQNVVDESRMGVREVALSAMPPDAGHLERMLIIENMIDLLGIRRPTGGNGNVDGMEIGEIDVDHAAG